MHLCKHVQAIIVIQETVEHKFHEKCPGTHTRNVKLSVEHRIYCRPVQFILDISTSYFLAFNWFIDNGIE